VPDGLQAGIVVVEGKTALPHGYAPNSAVQFGDGYDPLPGLPDMRGKIAMYRGTLGADRIMQLETLGAVAVIAANPGEDVHWGGGNPIWGAPDLDDLPFKPAIPAVAVNRHAGDALAAAAQSGEPVRIVTELQEGWFKSKLPVVEIRGSEEPEKFVLLHGHYDAWDVGVGDNATGDAALLEIARVLWTHRSALKRSVRIAWWPGHSTGRFAGSTWYADHFAIDLAANCLAHINCDSPGCRDATSFENIPWMAENAGFVTGVVRDVAGKPASGKRPSQSSDFSFNNLGITGYFSSSSRIPQTEIKARGYYYVMGNGGNIEWHTNRDQLDVADPDILLQDIRVYMIAAFRNANATLLPYDWRALLGEFSQTVGRYQQAAGDRFDLTPVSQAIDGLDQQLARFTQAANAGQIPPTVANTALLALSRHLVPLNYVRSTQFRRDLGLPAPPLPWLAVCMDLDRYPPNALGFAQTQLQRGSNHVLAGLAAAQHAVELALTNAVDQAAE
jgi:hypothetical protein